MGLGATVDLFYSQAQRLGSLVNTETNLDTFQSFYCKTVHANCNEQHIWHPFHQVGSPTMQNLTGLFHRLSRLKPVKSCLRWFDQKWPNVLCVCVLRESVCADDTKQNCNFRVRQRFFGSVCGVYVVSMSVCVHASMHTHLFCDVCWGLPCTKPLLGENPQPAKQQTPFHPIHSSLPPKNIILFCFCLHCFSPPLF